MRNTNKRVLFLTDWLDTEQSVFCNFLNSLQITNWNFVRCRRSLHETRVFRWVQFLRVALRAFEKRGEYDVIICWHQNIGFILALLLSITRAKSIKLIVLTFMRRPYPKKRGIKSWSNNFAIYTVLKHSSYIFCYSKEHVQLLSNVYPEYYYKLITVEIPNLWTDVINTKYIDSPITFDIFAGGRTNRDYSTFLKAIEGLGLHCCIVCSPENVERLRVPDNVTIEYDLSLDDFLQKMRQSRIVVIPLKEPETPTGQLVLLQAMGMGKATIMSKGIGVPSYIRNGVEAILVDGGNVSALREAILSLIKDTELYSKLSYRAIQAFRENHSVSKFICIIQQLIK